MGKVTDELNKRIREVVRLSDIYPSGKSLTQARRSPATFPRSLRPRLFSAELRSEGICKALAASAKGAVAEALSCSIMRAFAASSELRLLCDLGP